MEAQLDLSFMDGPLDAAMAMYRPLDARVLRDTKTWSSLAAVLVLHAALTCILWISPKPQADSPKWIEVQLVPMLGSPDATGQAREGVENGVDDQAAPAASPPAQPEVASPPQPAAVKAPPVEHKKHTAVTQPHKRVETAPVHPEQKEVKPAEQSGAAQPEAAATQSEGPGGGGAAGGTGDSSGGGPVRKGEPGGSGLAERSFGAPDGPSFLHKVLPIYPPIARRLEKEGTVLLRVTIDANGRPVEVEVLQKAGFGFDEEAVKAVRGSTFVPAKKEGKALACKALLPIRFVLKNS